MPVAPEAKMTTSIWLRLPYRGTKNTLELCELLTPSRFSLLFVSASFVLDGP